MKKKLKSKCLKVCAWTALQKIGRFNGGLSVVPGSHRNKEYTPNNGPLYHGDVKWDSKGSNYLYVSIKGVDIQVFFIH